MTDKYTPQQVMDTGPCDEYDLDRITGLWAGRDALTAREISDLDIPTEDRLWALIYVCLDDTQRRLFACDCAEIELGRIGNPDPRSVDAIAVSRRYARGDATDKELAAAGYTARDAAGYTAWYTAWAAAGEAAWAAAWAAAGEAARAAQIDIAVEYAEGVRK